MKTTAWLTSEPELEASEVGGGVTAAPTCGSEVAMDEGGGMGETTTACWPRLQRGRARVSCARASIGAVVTRAALQSALNARRSYNQWLDLEIKISCFYLSLIIGVIG